MKLQRIPLDRQLQQVKDGIPAHPEFTACAIRTWAGISLNEYFGSAETKRKKLAALIGIPPGEEEGMLYREAAAKVYEMGEQGRWVAAEAAALLLAEPFLRFYRQREGEHGEDTEASA